MAVSYAVLAKNARLNALTTYMGASPLLRIYAGTPPATDDTALSGNTLLAELVMAATPFPAASGGAMTANAIAQDASADATGTATFFRIVKADGTTNVAQGTAGTSGTDLILTTTSIVATQPVSVTSLVVTSGN